MSVRYIHPLHSLQMGFPGNFSCHSTVNKCGKPDGDFFILQDGKICDPDYLRFIIKEIQSVLSFQEAGGSYEFWHPQLTEVTSEPDRPSIQSFVYLLKNNRNGYIKIGHSKNPSFREKTLQSEEPDIEMIFQSPGTRDLEKECHYRFSAYRVRGEWFRLSEIEIEEAKEFISREKN